MVDVISQRENRQFNNINRYHYHTVKSVSYNLEREY